MTSTNYEFNFVPGTLTITQEDATGDLDEANLAAVKVGQTGGASIPFSLVVHVVETIPDLAVGGTPALGDIDLADVTMQLEPVGPGSGISPTTCTSDTTTTDDVKTVTCNFVSVPVNTYTVLVTINGNYYVGSYEGALTVYDPSLGFTTGGGWFYWPGTQDKTNFGYTMKYNNKGTNLQGSLLMIRHTSGGNIYRLKSNALTGLALSPANSDKGYATFSGKSTFYNSLTLVNNGNQDFVVYVEDNNEPGSGVDKFWIQTNGLPDPLGTPASSTTAVNINRGNIVVPHINSAPTRLPQQQ